MKTLTNTLLKIAMVIFILLSGPQMFAKDIAKKNKQTQDNISYNVYKGMLKDKESNDPLVFATIAVEGENTATISNLDGEFILKISKSSKAKNIIISHLGYENLIVSIRDLKADRNILKLEPAILTLSEITVFPDSPEYLIRMVLNKVRENYGNKAYNMTGFYREYIKKKNRYVGLSEAVVYLYKASYTGLLNDQIQIYKGRKGTDVRKLDTVLFKLQGGPATTMLLDIIKNPTVILDVESLEYYNFKIINMIKIGDKLNYVIEFKQKDDVDFPLYDGRYYVDMENLALTAADFSLNVTNPVLASRIFLRKKPVGAKVIPVSAKYSVKYREQNGEWFFNYAKGEVKFKVNWDRKLFNSNYTVMSEIAITDRTEEDVHRFKNKEKFKRTQILSEKIGAFTDDNYWGEYNLIEPDQSIEVAIRRIKRLMKK